MTFRIVVLLLSAIAGGVIGYFSNRANPWFIVYGVLIGAFLVRFVLDLATEDIDHLRG